MPLLLFLAAVFVVKLVILAQLQHHPLLQPDGGLDAVSYVRLARAVLAGDLTLGPGLYYLSPLYIYFLAVTLGLSDSFTWVRLVQIALGTAAVGCVFVTARDWFGRRAAWVSAGLAALTGTFTFYEILVLQASLDTFLTAAGLMCLAKALSSSRPERLPFGILAGIVFGLQVLNRPNVIVAIGGVALSLLLIRRVRVATLLVAGVLLAIAPVVARNAVVSGQLAVASSQGGLNFYIGNHEGATGQYVAVPGVRANVEGQAEDTRRVAERAAGHPLTDSEVSAHFTRMAADWIRASPGAALRLFARKLALVFNARHQRLDFSYPYYARDTGSLLILLFVGPWLLVPLGLTGLVAAVPAGRRAEFLAWSSFVPWYALGVALFFVAERYRMPMFVPLCVASGGAVDAIAGRLRLVASVPASAGSRAWLVVAVPALVFVCGAILAGWPFRLEDGRFEERLRLSKVLMNRGDYGAAVMELERAHAIDPGNTTAEFSLGMAMVVNGRAPEGIAHARHAVDAGVPILGARYAVASAMLSSGDSAGAVALLRTFSPGPEDDADSCYQVGLLAIDAGLRDVAERYLARALALRPGWSDAKQALDQTRAGVIGKTE